MSNAIPSNSFPGASQIETGRIEPSKTSAGGEKSDFFETLQSTINQVDQLRTDAQTQVGSLLHGDGQDVHSAMIAVEKADLAFQLMMQVRNKIVQAYEEVSKMSF